MRKEKRTAEEKEEKPTYKENKRGDLCRSRPPIQVQLAAVPSHGTEIL
jgi:hypothetical protein